MRFRCGLLAAFLFAFSVIAVRPAAAQLTEERSPGLRVIYFDGTEGYLVPHATRTALNSLAFQKKLFGFDPKEDVTVLLLDLSDSGNAGASSVPNNLVSVQIAPLGFSFETLAANERMNTIMNHELVHVATMDQAAGSDRMFRRLFGGKVLPVKEQPESILYFYLTSPRVAAPRWFHEGIAVFVDTWMAGGLGRVQSGYDEMVFRAMVRDNATFYNPLGLVSKGTDADFQLEINSYLYGARFMTWLARRYSPEQADRVGRQARGQPRLLRGPVPQGVRREPGRGVGAVDCRRANAFNRRTSRPFASFRSRPYRDVTSRALGSVSRAYFDPASKKIYAAFNYPGVVAHVGAIDIDSGAVQRIMPIKGPVIYTVTSLAWDPDARALFYTTDNGSFRDLMQLDPATGKTRMLQKDARIGDIVFSKADKALWGLRHLNGFVTIVRIPAPYTSWEQMVTLPYGTIAYDLDVSPDGTKLVASFGEITGAQDVRVMSVEALKKRDATPLAKFDFSQSVPNDFTFSADGRYLYGSSYLTGRLEHFSLRARDRGGRSGQQHRDGILPPGAARRRRPAGLQVHRQRLRPHPHHRHAGCGRQPDHVPRRAAGRRSSGRAQLERRLADGDPVRDARQTAAAVSVARRPSNRIGLPDRPGLQDQRSGRHATEPVGSDPPEPRQRRGLFLAGDAICPPANGCTSKATTSATTGEATPSFNKADFYDLFGPTKTGRKGYVVGVGRSTTLVYDEPRRLTLAVDGSFSGNLDRLPDFQNVPVDVNRLAILDAELSFQRHEKIPGRGRCRVRHAVDGGGAGIPRRSIAVRKRSRQLRSRHGAAGQSHVDLVSTGRGLLSQRSDGAVRQLLLRRLRQQLRR